MPVAAPKVLRPKAAIEPGLLPETTTLLRRSIIASRVEKDDYEHRLEVLQGRLNLLTRHKKFARTGVVAVFEGVDAAGKGGAIRRVTQALDARLYRVHPIAAPTEEERVQPYLWRFWRNVPRARLDRDLRSLLVRPRARRACRGLLRRRGLAARVRRDQRVRRGPRRARLVVAKIWLHVDPTEQLKRFEERQATGFKRFKITEEDWRNRQKWPAYEVAACEMFERTSTEIAPWRIVAANDKRGARLAVLETICERLERAIERA
jgi:polyphosphate kinase 2 (PPK2 family)